MTVLVAIPYYRCADLIEEAVRSVLAQTYRDLVCIVGGDGEAPPVHLRDGRLVVVPFPTNRGAPFTQQAMLHGSPFAWYAPHGADDWTEPDYLERLMALDSPANGTDTLWIHRGKRPPYVYHSQSYAEFGVYSTALLRSVGGYGIDRRCGQDTLLYQQLLPNVQPVVFSSEPRYHKRMRHDSLTHSPRTGHGSAYRREVVAHNRRVAAHCDRLGYRDLARIRTYRASLAGRAFLAELEDRVALVAAALT